MSETIAGFAELLEELRGGTGLSKRQWAIKAGVPEATVGDLLRGKGRRLPQWEMVHALVVTAARSVSSTAPGVSTERLGLLTDLEWWRDQHDRLRRRVEAIGDSLRSRAGEPVPESANSTTADIPVNSAVERGREPDVGDGGLNRRVMSASVPVASALFVGRSNELAHLDRLLSGSARVLVTAVHGMGGVGKTTLAARYVRAHAGQFTMVWWITADSPTAIDAGLADLAVALDPGAGFVPQEQRTTAAIEWFAARQGWLLVLDNLTDPGDAQPLLQQLGDGGTVLITSRRSTGWRGVVTLPVDILPSGDAANLLTRTIQADWPDADLTGADTLCTELGGLPLAIEQAGAYIAQTRITPAVYLRLLNTHPARMFTATGEGGNAQRTMARVWHVTLDRLADTPAAGQMLRRLAWHAPDNIDRVLVIGTSPDPDELDALGRLASYSMITLDADAISIHRLVQTVTRTPDSTDPHRQPEDIAQARETTAECLAGALSGIDFSLPADWPVYQAVLPHALTLLGHTNSDNDTTVICALAVYVARYVCRQGDIATAISLFTRASRGLERLHGHDHPDTLTAWSGLATAYEEAGNLDQAIPLLKATLADQERVLGRDHTNTMATLGNLANAHRSAGDLDLAIPLQEAMVAGVERILGPDDPGTLTARANLAGTYATAGDTTRAISIFEATHAGLERVLGPDHPTTLRVMNNLANAYRSADDLDHAISLLEAVNRVRVQVLGPDHPDTLISRDDLASAHRSRGELDHALSIYKEALKDCERMLGPDHRGTLIARSNLADTYASLGESERAIPLLQASLADHERVLGLDHPDTLIARQKLARVYQTAGYLVRAARLYKTMLAHRQRVLRPNHPDIPKLRNNLAYTYLLAGNFNRAIPLYETTLADRERILGPDHPDTLSSRNNLAFAFRSKGDLDCAVPLYEAALADYERVFGHDHSDTLISRSNLAGAYQAKGDADRAVQLYKAVLVDAERTLGADAHLTKTIRSNLKIATSDYD